jgi:Ca2+-binding RTX toxin-like protein
MATINGTSNNESLLGNAEDDLINGLEGNDTLEGGAGTDTLVGGLGDDTYLIGQHEIIIDTITELENQGTDSVQSWISYTLPAHVENLKLQGSNAINGTGNELKNEITGNNANNVLIGGGGADTILGGLGNDSITGSGTADLLKGEDGDDTLVGGGGSDELYGGAGNDKLSTAGAGEAIKPTLDPFTVYNSTTHKPLDLAQAIVDPTANILINNNSVKYTGADKAAAFFEKLEFGQLEGVNFSLGKGIVLTSGDANIPSTNGSTGFGGSNSTEGDADLTKIVNELFPGSASFDAAILEFEFTVTQPADAATDPRKKLTQVSFDILFGSEEYPEYVGNFVDIAAVYVDDVNYAFFENGKPLSVIKDNLTPGNFYDNTNRGLAIEYDGMSAPLKITGNLAAGTTHKIRIAIADTKDSVLDSGIFISNLVAVSDTGETGVRLNNSDILDGGTGIDTMSGGFGNDIYYVDNADDVIEELDGQGTDTVKSSISYVLSTHLENITLLGTDNITGKGNIKNNRLIGNSGNNVLEGGDGNDTLDGGGGTDTLVGGAGDDTYIIRDSNTVIVEDGSSTNDIVKSDVSYTLSNSLDKLYLVGLGNLVGTGNATNNLIVGNTEHNTLIGGAGDDTLNGGEGNDSLEGGEGDDTYYIDSAFDTVKENNGQGTDTIISSVSYTLAANLEHITLTGKADIDATGNESNNILTGNSGKNKLAGGKGNDTYYVDNVADVVIEADNEGTDSVFSSVNFTLDNHIEHLTLTGTDNIKAIGNALNNTLTGNSGNNTLDGGGGADMMIGGLGDDTYYVDFVSDNISEFTNQGNDTVYTNISYSLVNTHLENIILTGADNNKATGNAFNNALTGNSGNNTLDGGLGNDTLTGGLGSDTYIIDNANDLVIEDSGTDIDTVLSSVGYALSNNFLENLQLVGINKIDGIGNALNNLLVGNTNDNKLVGNAGDDTLRGSSGNDTLDGGTGNDLMEGGSGSDYYIVDSIGDIVKELALVGTDVVQSNADYTLGAYIENLILTGNANLIANGNELNNTLTGNAGHNTLIGGRGDDVLDGATGNDSLIGGLGNDTYIIDSTLDVIQEADNQGIDTVQTSINYTLGNFLEHLTLTGFNSINGTGNTLNNIIRGNASNNLLDGAAGMDTLKGGAGDDTYLIDNFGDVVIEASDEGNDTVRSLISYNLGNHLENLTLLDNAAALNATGNSLNNHIIGNAHNNLITGLGGNDTLEGGGGDDIYIFGQSAGTDTLIDNSGTNTLLVTGGLNTAQLSFSKNNNNLEISILNRNDKAIISNWYSSASSHLSIQFANGTTLSANDIEALANTNTGGNSNTGSTSGNDALFGTANNDTLDGGLGADTLTGGAGNDTYFVDSSTDIVIENSNEGTDTIKSTVSYTLPAFVENLVLLGTANLSGTGNTGDNQIEGNAGNNTLDGGSGKDTLQGAWGNDTYIINSADTVIKEEANSDIDTVKSTISYTLGDNLENLVLLGAANLSGTGNKLDNNLLGNDGNNTLTGGEGRDTLRGGLGDDTYLLSATDMSDVIIEQSNGGIDTIESNISYALTAHVENLTLLGSAHINAAGNNLANRLMGNEGNNILQGDAGNDTLIGGAGNDVYVFGRGFAHDTIDNTNASSGEDSLLFEQGLNPEHLWLQQMGNHLVVNIVSQTQQTISNNDGSTSTQTTITQSNDQAIIKDWFSGTSNTLDKLQLADGKTLLTNEVQVLVDAMAKFAPFVSGSVTLSSRSYDELKATIIAAW